MKSLLLSLLIIIFLLPELQAASLSIGSGYTSPTEGRRHPILYGAIGGTSHSFSLYGGGFRSTRTYHSMYQLNYFQTFKAGKVLWGDLETGLGWGFHYYKMGLKKTETDTEEASDFASGPAFRVFWEMTGYFFMGIEAMFGLRNLNAILLSTQDVSTLVIGVRF